MIPMTQRDFQELLPALIGLTLLLCCCCTVLIGGGAGAFFFFRRRNNKPAASSASVIATPATPATPPPMGGAEAAPLPTPFGGEPEVAPPPPPPAGAVSDLPGPATPIDPDDIRARLLGLNGSDQPYVVQATGYKIVIAPTAITGYLLEVAFDFVERVARFVETNPALADPRLKHDARQVLEANGWTVRE
jgi:hypothetical protein